MGAVDLSGSSIPESAVSKTALLAATWVYSAAWALALCWLVVYLRGKARDPIWIRLSIICLFVNETVTTVLHCIGAHTQLIEVQPGTLAALSLPKTVLVAGIFNVITLCGTNLILIRRYHLLTRRAWITYPLAAMALISAGLFWYTSFLGLKLIEMTNDPKISISILFKAASDMTKYNKACASVEMAVVSSTYMLLLVELTSYLRQVKLGARRVIGHLTLVTLECGIITVGLAAAYLAVAAGQPDASTGVTLTTCCGKAYFLALLLNLILRDCELLRGREASLPSITSTPPGATTCVMKGPGLSAIPIALPLPARIDFEEDVLISSDGRVKIPFSELLDTSAFDHIPVAVPREALGRLSRETV